MVGGENVEHVDTKKVDSTATEGGRIYCALAILTDALGSCAMFVRWCGGSLLKTTSVSFRKLQLIAMDIGISL